MRSILVPCLLAMALLSACAAPGEKHLIDSKEAATPSASVPASPSPATEPARELPLRPAMQQSEPGAEAQVRYALEIIEYAKVSGETDALLELSREGCVPCADVHDAIKAGNSGKVLNENVTAGSASIEGDEARVDTSVSKARGDETRSWQLTWNATAWEFGPIVNGSGL